MSALQTLYGLPELGFDLTIQSDQDWVDGIGYTDPNNGNAPVALDGILFALTVRKAIGDPSVVFYADTTGSLLQLLPASVGSVNSCWVICVPVQTYPAFLPAGSYVFGLQGIVGTATRNLGTGNLIVTQGVA